jgi:hypothetical protein
MASVRQVFNPFEDDDVIGITNYIDVGIQLVMPLQQQPGAAEPPGAGLSLGASWQVGCVR